MPTGPDRVDDNEVHVWRMSLRANKGTLARLKRILSPDEIERAARLRAAIDQHRFMICRASLRTILARYVSIEAREIAFGESRWRKPMLRPTNAHSIRFNVSRSDDVALVAVAKSEVGIDVERIRRINDVDVLIDQHLAEAEQRTITRLAGNLRERAFLRLWTLKEAYLKGSGEGLTRAPERLIITLNGHAGVRDWCALDSPGDELRWTLSPIELDANHVAAFAVNALGAKVQRHQFVLSA